VPRLALIVDDHRDFRKFARRLLERAGFEVAEASDGFEGLSSAAALRPDIVLLDIQLPDVDGIEVARRLAEGADAPVVALTSSRDAADYGARLASSRAAGFLPKADLTGDALRSLCEAGG
jgi:CheY-like chemotaxis protein